MYTVHTYCICTYINVYCTYILYMYVSTHLYVCTYILTQPIGLLQYIRMYMSLLTATYVHADDKHPMRCTQFNYYTYYYYTLLY